MAFQEVSSLQDEIVSGALAQGSAECRICLLMARTRSARTRVSRRQCGEEQTRLTAALVAQVDPLQKPPTWRVASTA